MDGDIAVEIIKRKFLEAGHPVRIPLQRKGFFRATLVDGGVEVDNLGDQPFLPWEVFRETIKLLLRRGGRVGRGDAMQSKLGEAGLPLDSIEGHIAYVVYSKRVGTSVLRRISPIAAILVWAGLCDAAPGELILK